MTILTTLESYRYELRSALDSLDLEAISEFINRILQTRSEGGTVYVVGNGGSAATASHMAQDLMIGSRLHSPPLRVVALTDSTPILTATANDRDFGQTFSLPLSLLGTPGDLLVAVSASGNSRNLLAAMEEASAKGMTTVAITGFDGGQMCLSADLSIHVPTRLDAYGPAEDAHLAINHMVCKALQSVAVDEAQVPS